VIDHNRSRFHFMRVQSIGARIARRGACLVSIAGTGLAVEQASVLHAANRGLQQPSTIWPVLPGAHGRDGFSMRAKIVMHA
jgi:hypothetical protein